jgi:parallel beta-helix repeat protein
MASLAALVAAYDLDAGDIIHVDAGSYGLVRNVVLASQDSGVRIEGPALGSAVLNRGNTNAGSYVVELAGADDVTISRLTLTGGHYGVYASNSADSDRFRLENSIVTSNGLSHTANISIGSSNEDASMVGNTISNSLGYGIVLEGARGRIQGNEIFGNTTGVYSYYLPVADRIEITGNQIHHNTGTGVRASGQVWVANNTVWGHSSSNSTGISASDATVESNQVFDNFLGINSAEYSRSLVTNNRVYRNATTGIKAYDQTKVLGNTVYSNSIGIEGAAYSRFIGEISNNLVYANSNQGIKINYGGNGARITNNTVYQPVGNAVLIEGNSNNVALRNNILWVDAGNDIYVTNDSKTGFSSNYNLLYTGPDVNANVGYWDQGGVTKRDTLADWRLATGQDGRSIDSNPNFVDLDGADNVLGYSTLGTGYNGGLDDNFYQARLSGAIDSADAWAAPATDILGRPRVNDPGVGNTGSSDYVESGLGSSQFAVAGTAKGWRWNGTYWNLNFPAGFTFPFYESNYSSVSVSTEGFLYFAGSMSPGDNDNSTDKLKANRIIAPLWDNIHTNGSGDDIFVDTSVAGQVTIRWNATNEANNADVNFSVTLSNDGSIQFNYGSGNTGLTPTVGISRGDGNIHVLSTYNNASTLTNAESIRFVLTPGVTFADMGAYEFRGNSNDAAPPQIVGTDPAFIEASGACDVDLNQVKVFFSEEVNAIDANAPANYELRRAVNGTFGDSDDVIYPLTPSYSYNSSTAESVATVGILPTGGTLPDGDYRLTVFGRASNSIHDTAGNRLDGNRDGSVTGSNPDDYVRQFFIGNSAPTNITLSPTSIAENAGNDVLVGEFSSTDPDIGNTFAYTFASGTGDSDNSSFTINGNQLRAASSFNFETKSSYTVRVRSTDQGGLFVEKVFTIQVTDVNENPTNIALSAVSIPENSGVNTTVGALSTVDPDAGSSFTYALVSGNGDTDNGAFNIDGVNLRATNSFDFESKSSYTVRIRSTDQAGLWTEKSFTIQVLDKNESPSDIVLSSNTVPENAGPNAVVGTLSTTDADANNTFTYSLATGAGDSDNAAFNIDGNKLRATNSLDYETKPTYTVRVRSTDQGGLYTEKSFTIQVSNVPEGVEIFGTSGNDVFVATYTGDATNHAWLVTRGGATVFNGPIAADTPLVIDGLAGTDSLQINGRSVDDLVTLEGNTIRVNGAILQTIRNESVKSVTGLGNDRLTINMPLASGTSYSYDGGTGTDTFEASSGDNTWSVTGAGIGTLNTSFAFLGIESLRGGSGTDQFILGLNGKLIGQVIGGAGNDTLNMSAKTAAHTVNLQTNTATSTGGIGGIESFIGGNSATINDILIGPNSATNWTIDGTNAGSLTSATTNTVSFVGFESLTGGTAVDAFVLTNSGVLTKTLTGGTATGVIDTLNLSAKTSALDFRLDASTSNIPNAIGGYVGFETITANGHADTKITRVNNTTSAWSINTAGHVLISNVTYVQVFGIVGGAGTDTLTGPALSVDNMTHWRLDSAGGGIVSIPGATIGFTGMNNLTGNTGADAFEILPSGSISGNINAGTGTGLNSISYQQWTTSVSVNLSVTTAGNASGITGSLTNIQMVTGGSGNDTLRGQSTKATVIVGLAGSDTLVGGSQRDLLLGGVGADNLSGVASDDVLVSGTTSYDTNRDALFKIYSEWISTRTFAQRAANIWGNGTGTRLNGSYFLNNSPEPADSITDTVFSDGDLDSLTGGLNQDWFFAAGNEIVDLLSGDRKDG